MNKTSKVAQEQLDEERLKYQLDVQSQQINRVLSHHRVPTQVAGGMVRPVTINFDLQAHLSAGLERVRHLTDDLKTALGVADVSLDREGSRWRLRVARPYEPPVALLHLLAGLDDLPPATAAVGLTEDGSPVLINFADSGVTNVLVAGGQGAGKTTLLRAMAAGLALANRQCDLQLVILDASGAPEAKAPADGSLTPLGYLPHLLTDVAQGPAESSALLDFLVEEVGYRRRQGIRLPRVVVLIDGVVTLLEQTESATADALLRLLQHGPEAGLHLVLATNRPQAPQIDALFRSNLSIRLVGRVADANLARQAAGVGDTQAEYLLGGGDFLAVTEGEISRFQAAYVGDYDLHLQLTRLYTEPRPRLLARPYNPQPRLEPEVAAPRPAEQPFSVRDGLVKLENSPKLDEDEDDSLPWLEN